MMILDGGSRERGRRQGQEFEREVEFITIEIVMNSIEGVFRRVVQNIVAVLGVRVVVCLGWRLLLLLLLLQFLVCWFLLWQSR